MGRVTFFGCQNISWHRQCTVQSFSCPHYLLPTPCHRGLVLSYTKPLMTLQVLIRPPGTAVPDGLIFYPWCYLFFLFFRHSFSEVPRPIALKLCHMVGIWLNFIIPLQKFGGLSPKKIWGPKTCKILVNFGPLRTLIANISGTAQDIQNRPTLQTMAIPPAFNEKRPVNFGPLTAWNYMWVWTH